MQPHRIQELFGRPVEETLTASERKNAAVLMLQAQVFEEFIAKKYPGFKRYSGEGAEAMQPAIDAFFREACASGVEDMVVCVPDRSRICTHRIAFLYDRGYALFVGVCPLSALGLPCPSWPFGSPCHPAPIPCRSLIPQDPRAIRIPFASRRGSG